MRRNRCDYLGSLFSLAVQQQAVGAVRGDDCAGKEQGRKEAGKGQAEAPTPQVVLNTCLQMQARLSSQDRLDMLCWDCQTRHSLPAFSEPNEA